MQGRQLLWTAIGALAITAGVAPTAYADPAPPVVTEPDTDGNGVPVLFGHTSFDLATVGYTQSELFIEGSATAYQPTSALGMDGQWEIEPTSEAPYKTRIVVNRPVDQQDFNGTVIVEWLNVSGGADASPDWIHLHTELIRQGYAWVGVSAQAVGLDALPGIDPARYASLAHPGDSYSYDMFTQAGQAVADNAATVLGGLEPDRLIAVGESQSAGRLVTYIDAVHPLAGVYDGFLVHSRNASGASLSQSPLPDVATPTPSLIRSDLDVPVLVFQTENDVGGLLARQDDSPTFRLWEVAGTAHFDLYGLQQGATDIGDRQSVADWFDSMLHPTAQPSPTFSCDLPINSGPQTFVLRAAVAALNRWVAAGTPPPEAARLQTISVQPIEYALDVNGNVLGGIRTPAVDAPVAKLNGLGQSGNGFCFLFGTTAPLTPEQLAARYQHHLGFVTAWSRATFDAARAGFLLPTDAWDLWLTGARSTVLKWRSELRPELARSPVEPKPGRDLVPPDREGTRVW